MSVTVSEYIPGSPSHQSDDNPNGSRTMADEHDQHREELLGDRRPKSSSKFSHTARGLEAIGFNENASMYHHGYRQYSVDSAEGPTSRKERPSPKQKERPGLKERKRTMSFIRKLIGGGGGGKDGGNGGEGEKGVKV